MKEIESIVAVKNYSMCLRDAVAVFTKEIINNLFDENHLVDKGVQTKQKFLKILERLSIDKGVFLWKEFEKSFSEIRQKLEEDLKAQGKTLNLEEFPLLQSKIETSTQSTWRSGKYESSPIFYRWNCSIGFCQFGSCVSRRQTFSRKFLWR